MNEMVEDGGVKMKLFWVKVVFNNDRGNGIFSNAIHTL